MDKVTSGTIFLDNVSNFLYVACDRETFLYLDVSVIGYFIGFSHRIVNDKIYNDDNYDYDLVGFPFLAQLSRGIFQMISNN